MPVLLAMFLAVCLIILVHGADTALVSRSSRKSARSGTTAITSKTAAIARDSIPTAGTTITISSTTVSSLPTLLSPNPDPAPSQHRQEEDPTWVDEEELVVDCAVIGAGPAGLAAALGLRKVLGPNGRIAIFERAMAFRRVGGQVGLMTVAFRALTALDPFIAESVQHASTARTVLRRYSPMGELQDEMSFPTNNNNNKKETTTGPLVIPWFDLQQALLQCLPRSDGGDDDPNGGVYLGHELLEMHDTATTKTDDDNYDDDNGTVILRFTNGRICRAGLVIGADGNLSRVRYLLFGEEPEFAGSCIWRMFVPLPPPPTDKDNNAAVLPEALQRMGESNVWSGSGKVLALQRMEDDRIYISGQAEWPANKLGVLDRKRYIGLEDGAESGGTTRNVDRLNRFLTTFASDFDPTILQFIRDHVDPDSILEHPIYMRPVGRPWGKGRITMVGDAAHMMPPNMAMGTPSAWEDAVALAHAVQQHGLTSAAFRHYETTRQPRVNRIAGEAIRQTQAYYKEKDETANPFRMGNSTDIWSFISNFQQDPIVAATSAAEPPDNVKGG